MMLSFKNVKEIWFSSWSDPQFWAKNLRKNPSYKSINYHGINTDNSQNGRPGRFRRRHPKQGRERESWKQWIGRVPVGNLAESPSTYSPTCRKNPPFLSFTLSHNYSISISYFSAIYLSWLQMAPAPQQGGPYSLQATFLFLFWFVYYYYYSVDSHFWLFWPHQESRTQRYHYFHVRRRFWTTWCIGDYVMGDEGGYLPGRLVDRRQDTSSPSLIHSRYSLELRWVRSRKGFHWNQPNSKNG